MESVKGFIRGHRVGLALLAILVLWTCFHLLTMGFWPVPDLDGDEAWLTSLAVGLLKHGLCRSSLFVGSSVASLGQGVVSLWAYLGTLAAFVKLFGVHLFSVRLASLVVGLGAACFACLTGKRFGGARVGLWALLGLVLSVPFAGVAHYARPDIFIAAGGALVVLLLLWEGAWFQSFLAGFVGAVLFLVHPAGAAFGIAALLFALFSRRWRVLLWVLAGFLAGGALVFLTNVLPFWGRGDVPDLQVHYRMKFIPYLFLKNPLAAAIKVVKRLSVEIPALVLPIQGFWTPTVAALGLAGLLTRKRTGILLLSLSLAVAFWVPKFRPTYFVFFFPLLAVGFGLLMARASRGLRWALVGVALVPELYFAQVELRLARHQARAQAEVLQRVRENIPPGAKALGTSTRFFWALGDDFGFLVSRDYVSGRVSLHDFMEENGWDYLVVEEHAYDRFPVEEAERSNPHALQNFAKFMDIFEAEALSDTSLFSLVASVDGGYLDVKEVRVYKPKFGVNPRIGAMPPVLKRGIISKREKIF